MNNHFVETEKFYVYTKNNDKQVKISKEKIKNYMDKYNIDINEAIVMYLDDNNIQEDEMLTKENEEGGKYKINHMAEEKKPRKTREAKISVEKQEIFNQLYDFLQTICDVEIITPNKLFQLKKDNLLFKLDLSQTRVKSEV